MPNSLAEVLKNLKNNQFQSIYFLQGEEPFFIDQISNYIEEHALTETEKSIERVAPVHKKQLITYLKLSNKKLGYLLNFGQNLMKDGITRIINGDLK